MPQVRNFTDVTQLLAQTFRPPTSMREAYSLERMHKLTKLYGNPQNQLKVIHVTATSGKTSTCYYTSALLAAAGQKVGMTVSPHIDEINERVQINLTPLPEAQFCQYFNEFLATDGLFDLNPSYFEVMITFAFWVFVREQVDYAVIEVGLGGLGDATNVVNRPDKLCVIGDIDFDHMHVLGDTIAKIARQKAGIIQQHNPAMVLAQDEQVLRIVEETARAKHAALTIVEPRQLPFLAGLPPFAQRDWQLAQAAYALLKTRDSLPGLEEADFAKTSQTVVPARMEIVEVAGKTVVMDGSHNQQKLAALLDGLQQRFAGQPVALLMSFTRTRAKQITETLQAIAPIASAIIVTSFDTHQYFHHHSLDTQQVQQAAQAAGISNVTIQEDPATAFKQLLQRPEPVVVVTGSFYLLSHIRPIIKKELKSD